MQQLYTPFLSKVGATIGRGIEKRAIGELIQKVTMGEPGALERLMQVDPQTAIQIKRQRVQEEQARINKTNDQRDYDLRKRNVDSQITERDASVISDPNIIAANLQQEQDAADLKTRNVESQITARDQGAKDSRDKNNLAIAKDNRKYIENTLMKSGKIDDFEKARAYVNHRVTQNKALAGNDAFQLTKEVHDQYIEINKDKVAEKELIIKKGDSVLAQTKSVRQEYNKDSEELQEVRRLIGVGRTALAEGSPISDKIVQSVLSRLSSSKVRALAELQQFKNYGTLAERTSGALSQFFSGGRSDTQKKIALDLLNNFEENMVTPGLRATKNYYRLIAKNAGLNIHSAVRFDNEDDVKSAFKNDLISRARAKEILKIIENK